MIFELQQQSESLRIATPINFLLNSGPGIEIGALNSTFFVLVQYNARLPRFPTRTSNPLYSIAFKYWSVIEYHSESITTATSSITKGILEYLGYLFHHTS